MRLIDADELELYLCLEEDPQDPREIRLRKYCFPCREIFEAIKAQPAMPSAEPKKGKWISEGQKNKGFNFWMHCSLCGYKTIDAPSSRTNYCPNCGADMKGEENE